MRGEYLRKTGSEITAVEVADGLVLPLEHLMVPIEQNDMPFYRHPLGGGLIAETAFVPDDIAVPYSITVGPDTQVVSNHGMIGQFYVHGAFRNPGEVSREMTNESRKLLVEQREMGIGARLLEIERRLASAAKLADTLF